jgi:hypothetical protein
VRLQIYLHYIMDSICLFEFELFWPIKPLVMDNFGVADTS